MKPILIFDFDGTLVDSKRDIAFSMNKTLSEYSLPPTDEKEVAKYISVGVKPLIHKFASYPGIDLNEFWLEFLKIYSKHCLDHTAFYPLILEVFKYYVHHTKLILSNKPQLLLDKICQGLV